MTITNQEHNQAQSVHSLSRRGFLGFGAAALSATAFGLAGCAPQANGASEANITDPTTATTPIEDPWAGFRAEDYENAVTETVDVDFCIIGSGASGMTAAVEAAQSGKKVLVLESQSNPGGNGMFTDCCFSYGSPQMEEGCAKYGLTVTPSEIIRSEIELYDYMVNPLLWADTIAHSADNTAWLIENGVRFAPTTDYYSGGLGKTPTALMWEGSFFSGGECMMKPLFATAEKLGIETRTNTRAKALKTADDGVVGVYAETKDGVVEVNAKAVILAGGGWAANTDLLAEYGGYDLTTTKTSCAPGSVGDTLKMAAAIGARQEATARGYMFGNLIDGISSYSLPQYYPAIWVNEDGDRFSNEDCGELCHDYTGTAVRAQKRAYIILNDAMIDEAEAAGNADLRKEIEEAISSGKSEAVYTGTDASDLAKQVGWTGDFTKTLATYEDYVAKGSDDEFGKNPNYLKSLGAGPLYALLIHQEIALSLGGIITNRHWQVVDEGKTPIKNLYAIGADGQMVYLGLYNLNTSGGHMATNVESGRYSVKHALETCF